MAVLPIAATISAASAPSGQATPAPFVPVKFHGWKGWTSALQNIIDRDRRAGGTGTIAQMTGTIGEDVQAPAWRFEVTQAAAIAFIAQVEALPSSTVYTLTDAWGRSLPIRISKASARLDKGKGPASATGSAQTNFMVSCQLTYERMPSA